ncbi:hypothetical protein ACERZ8_06855 [Tateyamaria armeniaca]|uniref:Uncharacterized protein n=1 Tax=Tateyamaria armeniaca TaxID=2518930 RepID=A0ABW8UR48_9RHOB
MMNWVKTLINGSVRDEDANSTSEKPVLSRQEMTQLFADDLARPALRKRPRVIRKQPRRLTAGRYLCAA